jgi:hypothetical protein
MFPSREPDCVEWDCLQCGKRIGVTCYQEVSMVNSNSTPGITPPEWKVLTKEERRRVAGEAACSGWRAVSEKYGIPFENIRAWMGANKLKTIYGSRRPARVPEFPPYNDNWSEKVKVAWLETYRTVFADPNFSGNRP